MSDKLSVFGLYFIDLRHFMADPTEPKKESVRIMLPPQPAGGPPSAPPEARHTVRINLPTRPLPNGPSSPSTDPTTAVGKTDAAASPVPRPPVTPVVPRPLTAVSPTPPPSTGSGGAAMPLPATPPSAPAGPKKETARITVLPDLPSKSAVQMKKTQRLIDMPVAEEPGTPLTAAPETRVIVDAVPKPLCWALLGVSAAILIIQIWNYFS